MSYTNRDLRDKVLSLNQTVKQKANYINHLLDIELYLNKYGKSNNL